MTIVNDARFPKFNAKIREQEEQYKIQMVYEKRLQDARENLHIAIDEYLNSTYEEFIHYSEFLERKKLWGEKEAIFLDFTFKNEIGFVYTVTKYAGRDVKANLSLNSYVRDVLDSDTMEIFGVAMDVVSRLNRIDWEAVFKNMPTLDDFIEKPTHRCIDNFHVHNSLLEDLMDNGCWVEVRHGTSGCYSFLEPYLRVVGFTKQRVKVEIIDKRYPDETRTRKTIDKHSVRFRGGYENLNIVENI